MSNQFDDPRYNASSQAPLNADRITPGLEPNNGSSGKGMHSLADSGLTGIPSSPVQARGSNRKSANTPNVSPNTIALVIFAAIVILTVGLILNSFWFQLAGTLVALLISLRLVAPSISQFLANMAPDEKNVLLATAGLLAATIGFLKLVGFGRLISYWFSLFNWDAVGALGEVFGALGQILIALLAVYIAWRQYVIEKDLTTQQNLITQQQTIDTYFQGISDLVLDEEGLLEDWPQERAIAEGRTAAILSSVDAEGKAKIVRFLSRARLLTPLKRDNRLGRPILDGSGGYQEDRAYGVRVIDLGVMLAGANLQATDLRWTDLSEANLIRANLNRCDLVKANLCRAVLYEASLRDADLNAARLFYGRAETASPRSRTEPPDYQTGEYTGAVIENSDFTNAQSLSDEQRYYCCAWGGSKTRATIPGGCEGIPNQLGR